MALQRSLLHIGEASLFETLGSLKLNSHLPKKVVYLLHWKPFKNDEKCFLFHLLHHIKNKLLKLCKEFWKENFNIKLVFNSFKTKSYFSHKEPFLVYKFTCASCSCSYIGKTCSHFKTRIKEHISKRITSLIFLNI